LGTLEHSSLNLNSLANSLDNLGIRKKTYNFNVSSRNGLIEVEILKIKVEKQQTIDTLINEEALLFAKFI